MKYKVTLNRTIPSLDYSKEMVYTIEGNKFSWDEEVNGLLTKYSVKIELIKEEVLNEEEI